MRVEIGLGGEVTEVEAPERLRVTGARRADGECLHEARAVPREPGARERPRRRDEPAEPREPGRAVREEGELLGRVEGDEVAAPRRGRQEGAPARGRPDPLEEIVSDRGVGEAALLLDGEQGKARDEGPRVEPAAGARRRATGPVDADAEEAARGRGALEHVAVEAERRELAELRLRVAAHARGEVLPGLLDDEPRRRRAADETERGARDPETDLDLGAHGHPLDEGAEGLGEEGVPLVAAVVTDLLAQEAGGDAEPELFTLAFAHGVD